MFAAALTARLTDGANLRPDRFASSGRGLPPQRVNRRQHAPPFAFCQPAGMRRIFRDCFADDEALRLPEARCGCPKRSRRLFVEHERELSHATIQKTLLIADC
jgi:hypothetical protein